MIYLASDHGGYILKAKIISFLKNRKEEVEDQGPFSFNPQDDYPDFIAPAIQKMLSKPDAKAIVLCRNGVGASIMANKFRGIRAGLSWNREHARSSRNDDNTNVLVLPADYISEKDTYEIVKTWLDTPFSPEERYTRRLDKIEI